MKQAHNVFPVLPIGKHKQTAEQKIHLNQLSLGHLRKKACLTENYQLDHQSRVDQQRSQRNQVCGEKGNKEQKHSREDEPGLKGQHHPRSGGNALSSSEFQVKRIIMTQDGSRPRIQAKQINDIVISAAEQQTHQPDGRHTFQAVPRKDDETRLRSKHPECICGACISASVLPDVNTVSLSVKICRLKQSEDIPDQ